MTGFTQIGSTLVHRKRKKEKTQTKTTNNTKTHTNLILKQIEYLQPKLQSFNRGHFTELSVFPCFLLLLRKTNTV